MKYKLDVNLCEEWNKLELILKRFLSCPELSQYTESQFIFPRSQKYHEKFDSRELAEKAISRARKAFFPLLGFASFAVATLPNWKAFLLSSRYDFPDAERVINGLDGSTITMFSSSIPRAGIFFSGNVRWSSSTLALLRSHHIPIFVEYHQTALPDMPSHLRPALPRANMTTFTWPSQPSAGPSTTTEQPGWGQTGTGWQEEPQSDWTVAVEEPTPAQPDPEAWRLDYPPSEPGSGHRRGDDWQVFFRKRDDRNRRSEANESNSSWRKRQRRLERAKGCKQPSFQNSGDLAKVFIWRKNVWPSKPDYYVRYRIKKEEDIDNAWLRLENKNRLYDSHSNEWDMHPLLNVPWDTDHVDGSEQEPRNAVEAYAEIFGTPPPQQNMEIDDPPPPYDPTAPSGSAPVDSNADATSEPAAPVRVDEAQPPRNQGRQQRSRGPRTPPMQRSPPRPRTPPPPRQRPFQRERQRSPPRRLPRGGRNSPQGYGSSAPSTSRSSHTGRNRHGALEAIPSTSSTLTPLMLPSLERPPPSPLDRIPSSNEMQHTVLENLDDMMKVATLHIGFSGASCDIDSLYESNLITEMPPAAFFLTNAWSTTVRSLHTSFPQPDIHVAQALSLFVNNLRVLSDEPDAPQTAAIISRVWDIWLPQQYHSSMHRTWVRAKCRVFELPLPHINATVYGVKCQGPSNDHWRSSNSGWTIVLQSATALFFVIRLLDCFDGQRPPVPEWNTSQLVRALFSRGISFRTAVASPPPLGRFRPNPTAISAVAVLSKDHVLSSEDVDTWMLQCRQLLATSQGRAAYLKGGIIWRISVELGGWDHGLYSVARGPQLEDASQVAVWSDWDNPDKRNLHDDHMDVVGLDILCGHFDIERESATPISLSDILTLYLDRGTIMRKSIWPPYSTWADSGLNTMCGWTALAENWFQTHLTLIRAEPHKALKNKQGWRDYLHRYKKERKMYDFVNDASRDTLKGLPSK